VLASLRKHGYTRITDDHIADDEQQLRVAPAQTFE